jgi:hypothetical protein
LESPPDNFADHADRAHLLAHRFHDVLAVVDDVLVVGAARERRE